MSATSKDAKDFANIWLMRFELHRLPRATGLYQILQNHKNLRTRSKKQLIADYRQHLDSCLCDMAKEIEEFKGEKSFLKRYNSFEKNMIKAEDYMSGLTNYGTMDNDFFYIFHIHTPYSEMKDDGRGPGPDDV